ncbi:DNA-directed RNA polymerase I subunit RPA49-like [Penaeus japonicus]|uniref:DNA-directed RNA polymerase I subunit RPA49-like n=1 Tax=Penaeus japonicus TaxID=27405 RepID=UPI001C70B82F|nr:DNA-directed RNA polymerase I subunit RPA49-like [Penaeus japonicus]
MWQCSSKMDSALKEETGASISPVLKKRKCLIKSIHLKQNTKAEPLLVSFSNGQVLDKANLKGTLYQNTSANKRQKRQRVFAVDTPKMRYAGKNFGVEAGTTSRESVFIGVLDKNTGKMELVETSTFLLHPVLEDIKSTNHHLQDSIHSLTFDEKQEQVATSFGTKKAKQYVNRRKQYQVNTEEMALAIDQAASAIDMKSEDLDQGAKEKDTYLSVLPECDREASHIEDVYKLEVIAPDNFLCYFEKPARHLLEGNDPDENCTLLFRELLASAKLEEEEENQLRLACVALYVEVLIKFLSLRDRDFAKDPLQECPTKIRSYIFHEYTQLNNKRRVRNREAEDRARVSTLILAFIANKYQLSVSTLLQSVPIERQKLDILMKVIGAHHLRDSNLYKLKLPLARLAKQYKGRSRK